MYVYTCVLMHMFVNARVCVRLHFLRRYACLSMQTFFYLCAWLCACMVLSAHSFCGRVSGCVRMCICVHVHMCSVVCARVYMGAHVCVRTHMIMYVRVFECAHVYAWVCMLV